MKDVGDRYSFLETEKPLHFLAAVWIYIGVALLLVRDFSMAAPQGAVRMPCVTKVFYVLE